VADPRRDSWLIVCDRDRHEWNPIGQGFQDRIQSSMSDAQARTLEYFDLRHCGSHYGIFRESADHLRRQDISQRDDKLIVRETSGNSTNRLEHLIKAILQSSQRCINNRLAIELVPRKRVCNPTSTIIEWTCV